MCDKYIDSIEDVGSLSPFMREYLTKHAILTAEQMLEFVDRALSDIGEGCVPDSISIEELAALKAELVEHMPAELISIVRRKSGAAWRANFRPGVPGVRTSSTPCGVPVAEPSVDARTVKYMDGNAREIGRTKDTDVGTEAPQPGNSPVCPKTVERESTDSDENEARDSSEQPNTDTDTQDNTDVSHGYQSKTKG